MVASTTRLLRIDGREDERWMEEDLRVSGEC
jgi:hypothetical protein